MAKTIVTRVKEGDAPAAATRESPGCRGRRGVAGGSGVDKLAVTVETPGCVVECAANRENTER